MFLDSEFLARGSHEEGSGPVFLSVLFCDGDESSLSECPTSRNQPPGTFTCQHDQDVAIQCSGMFLIFSCTFIFKQ